MFVNIYILLTDETKVPFGKLFFFKKKKSEKTNLEYVFKVVLCS